MSFEKMSKFFHMAFGYSNGKKYKAAIELYKEDLLQNPKKYCSNE